MSVQNYKNHIRWYIPHHVVFYSLCLGLFFYCLYEAISEETLRQLWIFGAILVFLLAWLSFMLRQHYGMTLQNRLVLQELRYRYFVSYGKRFEPLEAKLSFGQCAALRFAPDEELKELTERAIHEKLSPKEIKKAITRWKPDYRRI